MGHIVAIVCTVEADIELHITHIHCVCLQTELKTGVHHLGVVRRNSAITYRWSNSLGRNHVVCQLVEIVKFHIQVFADTQFQTEVYGIRALPSDRRITFAGLHVNDLIVHVLNRVHIGVAIERVNLVTQHTPTQTQLTVFQPVFGIRVTDEVLVGECPSGTYGTEVTPAVTFGVTRATVCTVVTGDGIALFVRVHSGCKISIQCIVLTVTANAFHLNSIAQLQALTVCQVCFLTPGNGFLQQVVLMTGHHTYRVVTKGTVVLQQFLRRERKHIETLLSNTTHILRITIILVGQVRIAVVIEVHTGINNELQAFIQLELERGLSIHFVLQLIILIQFQ